MSELPKMTQGEMKLIESDSIEETRDEVGFTNPNLHRRKLDDTGITNYKIGIYGNNSYRYVETPTHDEESTISEIP